MSSQNSTTNHSQRSKASAVSTPIYSLSLVPSVRRGSDETYLLLQYVDLASRADSGQESAIHGFVGEILRTLRYEKRGLLRSCYAILLLINGDPKRSAQTDLCLVHGSSIILLVVQEDKTIVSVRDPEPQVIADAIATFQCNNRIRARLGEPECDSMTIPSITMIGTRPIFYLVPVTRDLSEAVATAQYPLSSTVVKKCVVTSTCRHLSEGMKIPDFRQVALQHSHRGPLVGLHNSSGDNTLI